jgi:hypothetical protein
VQFGIRRHGRSNRLGQSSEKGDSGRRHQAKIGANDRTRVNGCFKLNKFRGSGTVAKVDTNTYGSAIVGIKSMARQTLDGKECVMSELANVI